MSEERPNVRRIGVYTVHAADASGLPVCGRCRGAIRRLLIEVTDPVTCFDCKRAQRA